MKKTLISLAIVAIIGILAYSQRVTLMTRVMEKGLETRLGADVVDTFEDGLHLTLCGAGGPLPAPNASGPWSLRSSPCASSTVTAPLLCLEANFLKK